MLTAHQVLTTALNAHRRVYPTRNTPGISRHSRQMPSTPPSVKAKVGRHLLKATLIASCLILLGGDISKNPGPGYRSLDHIRPKEPWVEDCTFKYSKPSA